MEIEPLQREVRRTVQSGAAAVSLQMMTGNAVGKGEGVMGDFQALPLPLGESWMLAEKEQEPS